MLTSSQEVLALGEDASSDSSWGGTASDEEKCSEGDLRESENEEHSTSRSTGSDRGVEETKETRRGDSSGEPSNGSGGSRVEAVLDDASIRRDCGPANGGPESPRETNGTGEESVCVHDSTGDAKSETTGFRQCATGGGVDNVCEADDNPPPPRGPPGGKDNKFPRASDPQGFPSLLSSRSSCSALEYSGSGLSGPHQAVNEQETGATQPPRDTVSESGTGGSQLRRVDGNIEEDNYATCKSDELRGVHLSGIRTSNPDADPVGRHARVKDGCSTTNGCIAPCGAVAAAGTGEGSLPSEHEKRNDGEASHPDQAVVMAAGRRSGSLLCTGETAAADRLDEEESEVCTPTRTRGGVSWSGEERGASMSMEEAENLRGRLRGVIGCDRFLDACR